MNVFQRWRQTALHNKAMVWTSFLVAFGTVFYAIAAACQIQLMKQSARQSSEQVERLVGTTNTAITKAIDDSGKSLSKALVQNKEAFDTSLSQAKKSLDASAAQSKAVLDANIAASHLDQRAWLGVRGIQVVQFEQGKSLKINVEFFNSGKSPALAVTSGTKFNYLAKFVTGPESDWNMNFTFEPGQSVPPQGGFSKQIEVALSVFGPRYLMLKAPTTLLWFYIYGITKYTDISNTFSGETKFCSYLGKTDTASPEMLYCNTYNDMK